MNLKELRTANIARDAIWDPERKLDLDFFLNELGGELGEACNVLKKIHREALGLRGSRATMEQLAEELSDTVIVLDLAAMKAGVEVLLHTSPYIHTLGKLNASARGRFMLAELGYVVEDPNQQTFDNMLDVTIGVAATFGIDLFDFIPKKFNLTSAKYSLPIFIGNPSVEDRLHPDVP